MFNKKTEINNLKTNNKNRKTFKSCFNLFAISIDLYNNFLLCLIILENALAFLY